MPATAAQRLEPPASATSGRTLSRPAWPIPVGVSVLALVVRLDVVLRGGGLYGYLGYDDGVYYAAGASLVSGTLPYRDFLLLHPPGIALLLAPFAALGALTGDRDAMAVARVAFMVLGAVNAGLTARVALVLGRRAALAAGAFAAVWIGAVYGDRSALLEPVGSLALLTALLLLWPGRPRRWISDDRAQLLAGVVLGLACCVKVWNAVPMGVLFVAVLLMHGGRSAARLALGAAAAGVAVISPFLVAAPDATIRMVFLDQLGRPDIGSSPVERLPRLIGVLPYLSEDQVVVVVAITLVVGIVLTASTAVALRARPARPWVALLLAHGLVLLMAPVYLTHYSAFLTVPLSLTLGAAAAVISADLRARGVPRLHRGAAATALAALLLLGIGTAAHPLGQRFPGERLATAVPTAGCVRADAPIALIQLDVLTRDLRRGCDVPVDFTGVTYDRLARSGPDGTPVQRTSNAEWQQYARRYLTSGSSTVLVRGADNGFDDTTLRMLGALPVLGRADGWAVLGAPRPR